MAQLPKHLLPVKSPTYITELPKSLMAKILPIAKSKDISTLPKDLIELRIRYLLNFGEIKFNLFSSELCLFLYNLKYYQTKNHPHFKWLFKTYWQRLLSTWFFPVFIFDMTKIDTNDNIITDTFTDVKEQYQKQLWQCYNSSKPLSIMKTYRIWLKLCDQTWQKSIDVMLEHIV